MAQKTETTKATERQFVVFRLAGEEFGVDISTVKEIIKLESITTIPNVEDYIKGVINLRGRIVVVIDLPRKLNMISKHSDKDTRIIIIEAENNMVGMIVDSVEEVLRITNEKISEAPEMITKKIETEYLKGVGVLGKRLVILLDLAALLGKKEIEKLAVLSKN